MAVLHEVLNRYKSALHRAGYSDFEPAAAPSAQAVEERLKAAGLNPLPELVEWFSWGGFPGEERESFFHETGWIPNIDSSLAIRQTFSDDIDAGHLPMMGEPVDGWTYPGTKEWLVIAHLDTSEIVSVDAGFGPRAGSVCFMFMGSPDPTLIMFSSLSNALEAATFCIEAGLWSIENGQIGTDDRRGMPSFLDLLEPPESHDRAGARYHVFPIELVETVVAVGRFDGRMECVPLWPSDIRKLAEAGHYPGSSMALAEVSQLPQAPEERTVNFVKNFNPEMWQLLEIEQDDGQYGALLSLHEPGKHWQTRRWIDPGQLAELQERGVVAPFVCGQTAENWPEPNEFSTDEIARLAADPLWLTWQRTFSP